MQNYPSPMVGVTSSIVLPNIGEPNCDLSHGLISMIERMKFHGLPSEDHDLHLKKFLRLTNTVRSLTNVLDNIRLATFLFTLAGQTED